MRASCYVGRPDWVRSDLWHSQPASPVPECRPAEYARARSEKTQSLQMTDNERDDSAPVAKCHPAISTIVNASVSDFFKTPKHRASERVSSGRCSRKETS
jgi:hypothetical protein